MMKSEDEAYDLFKMLSDNSINHASLSSYERSMGPFKQVGLYEIKSTVEPEFKVDLNLITQKLDKMDFMAQKMDQLLALNKQEPTYQNPSSSFLGLPCSSQEYVSCV